MRLRVIAEAIIDGNLIEEDENDIKEDIEECLRHYGGKGVQVESKREQE